MLQTHISLKPLSTGRMVGMRAKATPVRQQIEAAICSGEEVALDFGGMEATQSFIDELVGVLVLKHGPSVLDKLIFQRCSSNVRAIVKFVAADRADQFRRAQH